MRRPRSLIGPSGMGGMVGLWGASSLIKNLQVVGMSVGASSGSTDVTIGSVVMENTMLIRQNKYMNFNTGNAVYACEPHVRLFSTTVVRGEVYTTGTTIDSFQRVFVVEFQPGVVRVQRGVTTIGNGNSNNAPGGAAITAVNPAKSFPNYLGAINLSSNGYSVDDIKNREFYTDLTAGGAGVLIYRPGTGAEARISWEVVEFY